MATQQRLSCLMNRWLQCDDVITQTAGRGEVYEPCSDAVRPPPVIKSKATRHTSRVWRFQPTVV
eukprot:2818625-Prymnesium_polylepis.1